MEQKKTTGYKELDKILNGEIKTPSMIYGKPSNDLIKKGK